MQLPHGPRARRRALTLSLTTAALLGCASTALADTTVSIESGQFGTGQSGKYLFVRDTPSVFDQRMDDVVSRDGDDLLITDAVGDMRARSGCALSGAAARCDADGVVGVRFEAGVKNDRLANNTDLIGFALGNKGDDVLLGGSVRDELIGEQGDDIARGNDGKDVLFWEEGDDVLDGGPGGPDTINYAAAPGVVTIDLSDDDADNGFGAERDQLLGMENARGSKFADLIDGSDEANTLNGLGQEDVIHGHGGDDRLVGGDDGDLLDGDEGIDAADYVDRTAAVVADIDDEADDGNALDGPAGDRDNVHPDTENLLGGAGGDILRGHEESVANLLDGNGGDDNLQGRAGDDTLLGDEGSDLLHGQAGDDQLFGGIFDDTLNGGPDADVLDGEGADDTLDGGSGPDLIDGGENRDLVTYATRAEDVVVTLDSASAGDDGGASDGALGARDDVRDVEEATTGAGNDTVVGDGSAEEIVTGVGADTLIGSAGSDTLTGGAGVDAYDGGLDGDTLQTRDGEADQPISCGEGPSEDRSGDLPSIDEIFGDVSDLKANPQIVVEGDPAECEEGTFS